MQNRYTGDIGDFGKLGLLRALKKSSLTIGVNWYLRPNEEQNDDGKFVSYLKDESFRSCDESLWHELNQIVDSGRRQVNAIQNEYILKAKYYDRPLDFTGMSKSQRIHIREDWHKKAVKELSGVDVVFVDPDNGMLVKSAVGKPHENKYVKLEELADYYRQGSSVIYYQHKGRKNDRYYTDYHKQLILQSDFEDSSGLALKFKTTSQRYYFFFIQRRHKDNILDAVNKMVSTEWGNHFCIL